MNDTYNDNNLSMNPSTKRSDSHDLSVSKEISSNGCEYTTIMNQNHSSNRRKLILHFDNRNTLQVSFILKLFIEVWSRFFQGGE